MSEPYCPTCDGAEPVDECPVCKETRFRCTENGTKPPLNPDNGAQNVLTSQYGETVPQGGNGVLNRTKPPQLVQDTDETARNEENRPVVERLEEHIAETERLMEAYPNSRYTTGVYDLPLLKDALTALHDLRAENARLREALSYVWQTAAHTDRTSVEEDLSDICERCAQALTGEQDGSRFTNDEQEQE